VKQFVLSVLVASFGVATTAHAVIALNMQVSGPAGHRELIASTLDAGLESATRLGGHLGYRHGAPGTTDPDPANVPKVAEGPSWCVLSPLFPCDAGQLRVFGSADGTNGNLQLFARAEAPIADSFSAYIGATLTDRVSLPTQSAGLSIRLMLAGRHTQQNDQPLTSFPYTDFFYSLTLRRPDEAAPVGCDQAAGAPPCEVTFVEIVFSSSYDPSLGTTDWSWFATGIDAAGQQTITQEASGQGSGTTLQVFLPNPHQPMELTIGGEALADCFRTAGGLCRTRVDASQGAYVSFLGSYSSENGYVYAPEPSETGIWLAAIACLTGLARRRRLA
jgi:hypothetical protein